MKHKVFKKILAMVLSVSTVFAAIPFTASAENVVQLLRRDRNQ